MIQLITGKKGSGKTKVIIDKINAAFDKVKDGTIVPAADATVNDITPEDFEVK